MKIIPGTVEVVLVLIDKFYYAINFIVINAQLLQDLNKKHTQILLCCHFLVTANTLVNYKNGNMQQPFGNMTMELNNLKLPFSAFKKKVSQINITSISTN